MGCWLCHGWYATCQCCISDEPCLWRRPGMDGRSDTLSLAAMLARLPVSEQGSLEQGVELLQSLTAQGHPAEERAAAAEALGMLAAAEPPHAEGGAAAETGGQPCRLRRLAEDAFAGLLRRLERYMAPFKDGEQAKGQLLCARHLRPQGLTPAMTTVRPSAEPLLFGFCSACEQH